MRLNVRTSGDQAEKVSALSSQLEEIKRLPLYAEQLAAQDATLGARRIALLDELEAVDEDRVRDSAARAQEIEAATVGVLKALAALREARGRQALAEQAESAAGHGFDSRVSQIERQLSELGGVVVERLVSDLTLELQSARQCQSAEPYRRDEYGRQVWRSSTLALDEHVERVQALLNRARTLRLARLSPMQIEDQAAEIRGAARIGSAKFFNRYRAMPLPGANLEQELKR